MLNVDTVYVICVSVFQPYYFEMIDAKGHVHKKIMYLTTHNKS